MTIHAYILLCRFSSLDAGQATAQPPATSNAMRYECDRTWPGYCPTARVPPVSHIYWNLARQTAQPPSDLQSALYVMNMTGPPARLTAPRQETSSHPVTICLFGTPGRNIQRSQLSTPLPPTSPQDLETFSSSMPERKSVVALAFFKTPETQNSKAGQVLRTHL